MLRAVLPHHDLTVVFDDLGLDFTGMLMHQSLEGDFTADDSVANFFYTGGTETVCLARETKRRSTAFVGFEKWTGRPVWTNGFAFGQALVNRLKRLPGDIRKSGNKLRAFYARQLIFVRLATAKLITKQRLFGLPT